MTVLESVIYSILGIAIVFAGLVMLIAVIVIQTKIIGASEKKKDAEKEIAPAASAAAAPDEKAEAPGSAGELKLHNVPPRTAAMLMAITADKMGVPLNQLRFISIKCLDE